MSVHSTPAIKRTLVYRSWRAPCQGLIPKFSFAKEIPYYVSNIIFLNSPQLFLINFLIIIIICSAVKVKDIAQHLCCPDLFPYFRGKGMYFLLSFFNMQKSRFQSDKHIYTMLHNF